MGEGSEDGRSPLLLLPVSCVRSLIDFPRALARSRARRRRADLLDAAALFAVAFVPIESTGGGGEREGEREGERGTVPLVPRGISASPRRVEAEEGY